MDTTTAPATYRHEAMLYRGVEDFAERVGEFVRQGVEADEPTLVAVPEKNAAALRDVLGPLAAGVVFEDMEAVGRNPSRIIAVWDRFVAEYGALGAQLRGVGEPVWAARSREELVECERHEALLNIAIDRRHALWLVCPYDTETLPDEIVARAMPTHPYVRIDDQVETNPSFGGAVGGAFDAPLEEPLTTYASLTFGAADLDSVRRFVQGCASENGVAPPRLDDLVVSANELAANSVRHGGGGGILRFWRDARGVVCEVRDAGRIIDPLVGRLRPDPLQEGGFGLWLVNQVCDLVQVRTYATGTVVRVHMYDA